MKAKFLSLVFFITFFCVPGRADLCHEYALFIDLYSTRAVAHWFTDQAKVEQLIGTLISANGFTKLAKLKEIVQDGKNPFEKKAFWDLLEGSNQFAVNALLMNLYPSEIHWQLFNVIVPLYPKFLRLSPMLLDPAIASKMGEFARFVAFNPEYYDKPFDEVRAAFAKSLGTITVYRALAITNAQKDSILANGMDARGRAVDGFSGMALFMVPTHVGIAFQFQQTTGSPFLSVTSTPTRAGAALNTIFPKGLPPNTQNMIFRFDVPALSVVDRKALSIHSPSEDHKRVYLATPGKEAEAVLLGDFSDMVNEGFIYFHVPADQIKFEGEFSEKTYILKK